MTFVGKILVILIMAFALVFLGVSTVVFSTAKNWKGAYETTKTELAKKTTKASDLENQYKDAQSKLEAAKAEHTKLITERENRIKELDRKIADAEGQAATARGALEVAQKNAQTALEEATARKGETDTLNATLAKAQTQANQFLTQNLDLTDRNRILEREKSTAEQNAKDLRTNNARMLAYMRDKGIQVGNIQNFNPDAVPPPVEGRVKEVSQNKSVEITIGSNDGINTGQELYLFRTQPRPEFLGKVKIVSVYPNKAVADVIGQTVNRKRILEGDIVSSSFNGQ